MRHGVDRVVVEPDGPAWGALVQSRWAKRNERAIKMRRELGLPVDRPIIMTGHQAVVWHPGVLAKYLAARGAAEKIGAAVVWLVVDQDEFELNTIDVPVRRGDGRLVSEAVVLGPAAAPAAVATVPAFAPGSMAMKQGTPATPSVEAGIERIRASLGKYQGEANAARQVMGAVRSMLEGIAAPDAVVYATDFARTEMFGWVLEKMKREPGAMVRAYNEGVRRHSEAGIAELRREEERNRWELPLWGLAAGRGRRRVWSDDSARGEEMLVPRALLMTGLCREGACDLFVHGVGGQTYDPITEEWFDSWLGESLAPTAMVTADVRLGLQSRKVEEKDVARAMWLAHRGRHDPVVVGDNSGAREKERLVGVVRASRESGGEALPHYRALQEFLRGYREARKAELLKLEQEAKELRGMMLESAVAQRRDWAFALLERGSLENLKMEIDMRFAGG